ncbi:MAG TPA: YncE family protein [Pyrinomonadaceae bacterium]|nr:YncE family protein [Pyrinomonadaceae bacterium]
MAFLISRTSSTIMAFALTALPIACSTPTHLPVDANPSPHASAEEASQPSAAAAALLKVLADAPLTGGTTRLDYQSLDSSTGRLYIAHLGSDLMTVFDVNKQTIVGDVKDLRRVHGVLAVPELHRVYASATGTNELAVIDDQSLAIVARAPAGDYPDGIAYAAKENKIYVSDLHGKADTVIDAKNNQRITTIPLGGGAGNSQYDATSDRIFVTVDGREELAEIDPNVDQVVGRYPLTGCKGSHGLLIDSDNRLAFAACEENSRLVVFDLQTKKATATLPVGADPDVLAFDSVLHRLYVSAESGNITIFDEHDRTLQNVFLGFFAANAHTVAVDSRTHRVYWPLQNVGGKPILRITLPSDQKL